MDRHRRSGHQPQRSRGSEEVNCPAAATGGMLEREVRSETEHARVHVGRRPWPGRGRGRARRRRHERRIEAERHVVVQNVVDVQADHQPVAAKMDVLLHGEVDLTDAGPVLLARRQQIHLWSGVGQRAAKLRGRRRNVSRGERVGGGERRNLVGTDVRLVLPHRAEVHVVLGNRVAGEAAERGLPG